jgi:protein required for attachment to host cells
MRKQSSELTTGATWVVVADSSRADFYIRHQRFSPMELVHSVTAPDARTKEHDLSSDAPGRTFDIKGSGRHAMEPGQTGKEHLRENFARQVASELDAGRVANKYRYLAIVAGPELLGVIRGKLSRATQQLVTAEIDKEMTSLDLSTICAELDEQT